ncbi:MAG: response regulator [Lachnospiraceae bacterium]|nr:response regulator [Lachnospiraceae bacterium]
MYRVLIVDDDPLMRKAFRVMLSKIEGFELVYEAMTGEEGVEYCNKNSVDIIFMDIIMPGISGIEASKQILTHYSNVSIYILSGYTNFYYAKEALKTQVKEYMSKPLSLEYLKTILLNYKTEHKGVAKDQLERLVAIINEKNFYKVYHGLSAIVEEIYVTAGADAAELKQSFSYLGQSIIDVLQFNENERQNVGDLFPINVGMIFEKKVMELWLFQIVNYIFQRNSIQRYSCLKIVFEYIEEHIKEDIGLQEITENCAISQGYLSRVIREQFKISVMEYLHMRKLQLAKAYFIFFDESIGEVSFALGYNESSYFCKVFKKYEQMTVHQFKNTLERNKK